MIIAFLVLAGSLLLAGLLAWLFVEYFTEPRVWHTEYQTEGYHLSDWEAIGTSITAMHLEEGWSIQNLQIANNYAYLLLVREVEQE